MFSTGIRLLVLFWLLCLAACSDKKSPQTPVSPSPMAPAATVSAITVSGTSALLAVTQTTQLRAIATLSNGTTQDVTTQASWVSSNPNVAIVSSSGLITATGFGAVDIRAAHEGVSGGISVSIAPPASGSLLRYDVAPDVPAADLDAITRGIVHAQAFLASELGGDIPVNTQLGITVKVVATGLGSQEPGGGGACCTALDASGIRPFFDVRHRDWNLPGGGGELSLTAYKEKIAAHEYTHGWQYALGGLPFTSRQRLVDWLAEGMAEYVAFAMMVRRGEIRATDPDTYALRTALSTGQARRCLAALESISQSGVWGGDVGHIAVKRLIAQSPNGVLSLRLVSIDIGAGMSMDQAFQHAFGVPKQTFYDAFPAYLASLGGPSSCS